MSKNTIRATVAAAVMAPLLILGSGIAAAAPPTASPGSPPWSGEVWLQGNAIGEVWQCAAFSIGAPPFSTVGVVGVSKSTMTFAPNSPVFGACVGAQGPFFAPFSTTSAP